MSKLSPARAAIHTLRQQLLGWFAANARPLPWRENYQPYQVWVSEIMLQQTQMERGVLYFERWIRRFPGIEKVAAAPEEEILNYWEMKSGCICTTKRCISIRNVMV